MRRATLLLSLLGALGCARSTAATGTAAPVRAPIATTVPPPPPAIAVEALAELRRRAEAEAAGEYEQPGASKDHPLPTCGPRGSYIAVADETCADGSRPLAGNISRAARSRRGSVGPNASHHIIDLYVLECPEGARQIYVDMYGCDDARPSYSEQEVEHYSAEVGAGRFSAFIDRCLAEEARGPDHVSLMIQACLPVMPTALREQSRAIEASAWLAKFCAGTPTPSEQEPKRYQYLTRVLEVHELLRVRLGQSEAAASRERLALTVEYAKTCDVDPKTYEAWARAHPDL